MHDILTLPEAAEYLRIGQRTLHRLIADKRIQGKKVGSQWRFSKISLLAYVSMPSQPKKRRTRLHLVESNSKGG